jgi:riboflavin kinase/FMN adenylyltransferase
LLGRPVSLLGTVIKGMSLATRLGFPTANINPHHEVLPPSGIYAVRVIFNDTKLGGACYIGTRPTVKAYSSELKPQSLLRHIEVHIFNFRKNIYGKYLEIQFIKKIREDKKFRSFDILAKQVRKDIAFTKRLIHN